MGRESKQTRLKIVQMVPKLWPQSIESRSTGAGIADLWLTTCAIECKCLKRWPVKPETPVKLQHPLTLEQYRWLKHRYKAGYPAYVMLQANRLEWLLFAAPDAHVLMDKYALPRVQLSFRALHHWSHGLIQSELERILSSEWSRIEDHRYHNEMHRHEVNL